MHGIFMHIYSMYVYIIHAYTLKKDLNSLFYLKKINMYMYVMIYTYILCPYIIHTYTLKKDFLFEKYRNIYTHF